MTSAALLFFLPTAIAASPGWYHPDEVATQSKVFVQAAEALGPRFDDAQQVLARYGRGVEALDANLALHGAVAPDELDAWAAGTRRQLTGQYLQVQRHIDLLQDDMANTFGGALARQVDALKGEFDLEECEKGGGMAAMMGPNRMGGRSGGSCEGEDLNARIAEALDTDAELAEDAAEIAEIEWPRVGAEPRTGAPVALTGTAHWIDAHKLSRTFAEAALDRRRENLEDALAPLEDGLDAGEAEAVAQGLKLREVYDAGLAEDGARLRAALEPALGRIAKKGAPAEVGLCLVPAELGSCSGTDATADVLSLLAEDRKFIKELGDLRQ